MLKKKKSLLRQKNSYEEQERYLSAIETDKTHLLDYLLKHEILTPQTLNINPETAQAIYEHAYQLYAAGQYAKAKSLFAILLISNASEFQFLYGYATCCFMLKEYEIAAVSFMHCGQIDRTNPLPFFYAADCYIQMQDLLSTCTALEVAVKRSKDNPEYVEIKQRAQLTLDALITPQEMNKA